MGVALAPAEGCVGEAGPLPPNPRPALSSIFTSSVLRLTAGATILGCTQQGKPLLPRRTIPTPFGTTRSHRVEARALAILGPWGCGAVHVWRAVRPWVALVLAGAMTALGTGAPAGATPTAPVTSGTVPTLAVPPAPTAGLPVPQFVPLSAGFGRSASRPRVAVATSAATVAGGTYPGTSGGFNITVGSPSAVTAGASFGMSFSVTVAATGQPAPDGTWVELQYPDWSHSDFTGRVAEALPVQGEDTQSEEGGGGIAVATAGGTATVDAAVYAGGPVTLKVGASANHPSFETSTFPYTVVATPALTAVNPGQGAPGTTVTLSGSGLAQVDGTAATVLLGGGAQLVSGSVCTGQDCSPDLETFTVPSGTSPGATQVAVRQPVQSGSLTSNSLAFTVLGAVQLVGGPLVTGTGENLPVTLAVYGNDGLPVAEGTSIQIAATLGGFTPSGGSKVVVQAGSGGEASATFESPAPGQATLSAAVYGQPLTAALNGTIAVAPVVRTLSQPSAEPGDPVAVTGVGFTSLPTVAVAGVPAAVYDVYSDTSLTFVVPAAAVTGPVTVTAAGETGTGPVLTVAPVITLVTPAIGGPGTLVTIAGEGFGVPPSVVGGEGPGGPEHDTMYNLASDPPYAAVFFDGVPAHINRWSPTGIAATVPQGAGNGPLTVEAQGVTSAGFLFRTSGSGAVVLTSLSPSTAVVGDQVTLTGSGFGTVTGAVYLNGVPMEISGWSPSQITVAIAEGDMSGGVTVRTPNGGAGPLPLTVAPVITGVSPAAAPVGTTVTVAGTSFGPSGFVALGGHAVTPASWSDTAVTFVVPSTAQSGDVTITNAAFEQSNAVALIVPSFSLSWAAQGQGQPGGGKLDALPNSTITDLTVMATQLAPAYPTAEPALAVQGLPAGVTFQNLGVISNNAAGTTWNVALQLGATAPGNYTFAFVATAGQLSVSAPVALHVVNPPAGLILPRPMLLSGPNAVTGSVAGSSLLAGAQVTLTGPALFAIGTAAADGSISFSATQGLALSGARPAEATFSASGIAWVQALTDVVGLTSFKLTATPSQVEVLPAGAAAGTYPGTITVTLAPVNGPMSLSFPGAVFPQAAPTPPTVMPTANGLEATFTIHLGAPAAGLRPGQPLSLAVTGTETGPYSVPLALTFTIPAQVLYPGLLEQLQDYGGRGGTCDQIVPEPLALNKYGIGGWPFGYGVPYGSHWTADLVVPGVQGTTRTVQAETISDDWGNATIDGQRVNPNSWTQGNHGPGPVTLNVGQFNSFVMDSAEDDGYGGAGTGFFWNYGGGPVQAAGPGYWGTPGLPAAAGALDCFRVLQASPGSGVYHSVPTGFQFLFNEPVDPGSVAGGVQLLTALGGGGTAGGLGSVQVPVSTPLGLTAGLQGSLAPGAYTLSVGTALTDTAGQPLVAPYGVDFVYAPSPARWEQVRQGGQTYTVWVQAQGLIGQGSVPAGTVVYAADGQATIRIGGSVYPVQVIYATDGSGDLVTDPDLTTQLVQEADAEAFLQTAAALHPADPIDGTSWGWVESNGPGSILGNALYDLAYYTGQNPATPPSHVQVYEQEIAAALAFGGPTQWGGAFLHDYHAVEGALAGTATNAEMIHNLQNLQEFNHIDMPSPLGATITVLSAAGQGVSLSAAAADQLFAAEWAAAAAQQAVPALQAIAQAVPDHPRMQQAVGNLVNFNPIRFD